MHSYIRHLSQAVPHKAPPTVSPVGASEAPTTAVLTSGTLDPPSSKRIETAPTITSFGSSADRDETQLVDTQLFASTSEGDMATALGFMAASSGASADQLHVGWGTMTSDDVDAALRAQQVALQAALLEGENEMKQIEKDAALAAAMQASEDPMIVDDVDEQAMSEQNLEDERAGVALSKVWAGKQTYLDKASSELAQKRAKFLDKFEQKEAGKPPQRSMTIDSSPGSESTIVGTGIYPWSSPASVPTSASSHGGAPVALSSSDEGLTPTQQVESHDDALEDGLCEELLAALGVDDHGGHQEPIAADVGGGDVPASGPTDGDVPAGDPTDATAMDAGAPGETLPSDIAHSSAAGASDQEVPSPSAAPDFVDNDPYMFNDIDDDEFRSALGYLVQPELKPPPPAKSPPKVKKESKAASPIAITGQKIFVPLPKPSPLMPPARLPSTDPKEVLAKVMAADLLAKTAKTPASILGSAPKGPPQEKSTAEGCIPKL